MQALYLTIILNDYIKTRRKVWCKILKLDYDAVAQTSVVCSLHFDKDQYVNSKRLIKNAIPLTIPCMSDRAIRPALSNINNMFQAVDTNNISFNNRPLPSPKHNSLKRENKTLKQQVKRLKVKLDSCKTVSPSDQLHTLFGSDPVFEEILQLQLKRFEAGITTPYSDMDKTVAFTIFYNCGRKGYRY